MIDYRHNEFLDFRFTKLGGYLARKSDPPPGNIVMWRGLTRLIDIQTGTEHVPLAPLKSNPSSSILSTV
jgi:hypothetical protein